VFFLLKYVNKKSCFAWKNIIFVDTQFLKNLKNIKIMKRGLFLSILSLVIALTVLVSCQKDNTVTPNVTNEASLTPIPSDCYGPVRKGVYCTQVYDPVCGCNGQTYGNSCEASVAGIKKYTSGACGGGSSTHKENATTPNVTTSSRFGFTPSPCYGPVKKGVYCPQVYDPVCGCNGQTYGNSCEAGVAGIKSYTSGACGGGNSTF
jgi:hypothetical protein